MYKESDPFYHSAAWLRVRDLALERDRGMCVECMRLFEMGLIRKPARAQMVHHIIPRKQRPELSLVLENLESLCFRHHEEKHPERREKTKGDAPKMRVIKV